ncbi:hypothetical protein [Corynebacterium striatum]|uniref:hypothetical protein n=1 Tax=Corynebacterium striatum TaxID=43770 RepID=UPI001FC8971F|nr:hypothetical protein [Corynebacterium striatum]GKH18071.1 hypothetical protein CE91St29_23840 [Corynebacterium striatum]
MNTLTMRELTKFAIGGGWGAEESDKDTQKVMVIRGADFPAAALQDLSSIPTRFEKSSKVSNRALNPGDIVLEISGGTKDRPTGRTVFITQKMVDDAASPLIPASFCRRLVIDSDKADPRFVYYWLQNMYATGQTWNYQNRSTGIANFQFEQFLDREKVYLPDRQMQLTISMLLGALDDKITANVRVLKTANELVKNLYTAIPKSSNHAIESIGELVKKNVKPEEMDDSKALINLEHFDSKQIWISRHAQVPEATSAKSSFQVGDVLFGKLRPYFRKVGVAPIGGYCSTDVLVVRPREDSYRGLLLAAMSAEETVAIATQNSNGTRMPRAKWADIASCAIPDPDDPKSIELGKLMDVLIPKCNALIHENHVLARTRDELLPLLMSGRITVGEAEEAADEAASES